MTENEAQAQLLSEIYSLKLKHACGLNESIENICKWKRVSKEKETLDKKSLEADEKELYNNVTSYVKEQYNKALSEDVKRNIGFALTIFQRRIFYSN